LRGGADWLFFAAAILAISTSAVLAQAYAWRTAEIGGGGFVSGTIFHPTAPGLVYARTDVGGAYRMDAATNCWIALNDEVGGLNNEFQHQGVLSIALDPADPDRDPLRIEVQRRLREGFGALAPDALRALLGHADVRLRKGAQFELARRGAWEALLASARDTQAPRLARLHAIWGLGQGLSWGKWNAPDAAVALCGDGDAEVRAQMAKILGEGPASPVFDGVLVKLVADLQPRVRFRQRLGVEGARSPPPSSPCSRRCARTATANRGRATRWSPASRAARVRRHLRRPPATRIVRCALPACSRWRAWETRRSRIFSAMPIHASPRRRPSPFTMTSPFPPRCRVSPNGWRTRRKPAAKRRGAAR
jgi:hypothetical protein